MKQYKKGANSRNRPKQKRTAPSERRGMGKDGANSPTRGRALQVKADMRRDPSLTLTQAARNRGIDPRTVRKQIPSAFIKDSSGRIRARAADRFHQILHLPTPQPGVRMPIATKNSRERQLIGRWMDALNTAGRGDFSTLQKFPKGQVVGGVALPTSENEVQQILNALAEEESPFEGLYRTLARPS